MTFAAFVMYLSSCYTYVYGISPTMIGSPFISSPLTKASGVAVQVGPY
ncbi:hypothetical protein SAMN05421509_101166 [Chromohalobacter canadensis]|uniref:Uncharacterized protein n=1 Tax=Chromohalobacter canadensis TaxID=141389 RepID=A0A285VAT1_9GAMM|nr:hypothetical protein SAMN05421509_101166 [Chromohalobacter canadensis]